MRIVARRGVPLHAPENSVPGLIAGFTGGADVLEIGLQLTQDGQLVLAHESSAESTTGVAAQIGERTVAQLAELDFSATFKPRNSPTFQYYADPARRMRLERFPEILEDLPEVAELLIQIGDGEQLSADRREALVSTAITLIHDHGIEARTIVYSRDEQVLRAVRTDWPDLRMLAFAPHLAAEKRLDRMLSLGADGLLTDLESVATDTGDLTAFGESLERAVRNRSLRVGAALYPAAPPGTFTRIQWESLRTRPFIWSLATNSMLDVPFCRRRVVLASTAFEGEDVDRERFALGYAKANRYGEVFQRDGIHVRLDPYPGSPQPPSNPLEARLWRLENRIIDTAREWPYYSGGGVGFVRGIRGDFAAEVDYTAQSMAQATTLEMAVLNVDPGAHRGQRPTSFRDKDSFYDPHGAPPYVGVEHDEDDGYRINWNLGAEYDSNQYGRPVGDGKTPRAARLRLERRGAYFAAFYRNEVDARDWVCCGVARNHSLNPVVYLRCVGKRWRQESEANPDEYMPIVANHFVFRNLLIERYL